MRLKINTHFENSHKEAVLGVGWVNSDEVISAGDDHQLIKRNIGKGESTSLVELKNTIFPTYIHFLSRTMGKQSGADMFLLSSTDGKIYLINSASGKIEKAIDAHDGANLATKWSTDGTSFASCGEDGALKMWSKNGMLRSVVAQDARPIYSLDWNSNSTMIVYCSGENCTIKSLKAQTAPVKWKAHEGVVLCLSWSASSNFIVSGGEDCKYRVWDHFGRPIYSSNSHNYPITSVAWNPDGELFAVGAFNILRLCDKIGWSHSIEKLSTGSIYNISWSPDGTQLVAGCANGQVLHAHAIEKRVWWNNLEAIQSKRNLVNIRDVLSEVGKEKLETRDRVTKLQLGFNQLVVATTKQVYIFSAKNWNTPVILDLKEGSVSLVLLCEKYFLLVDGSLNQILTYEGRIQSTIKIPGTIQGEAITERTAAISNDVAVFRDRSNYKLLHLYETSSGKTSGDGKISHNLEIVEIGINQVGSTEERRVAFVDANGDCFIAKINSYSAVQRAEKIGSMINNIRFNNSTNMLAALQDKKLLVWTHPSIVYTDKELLQKSIIEIEVVEIRKSPYLMGFVENSITIRRSDGCLLPCSIPPFPAIVIKCISSSKWDQAIRLCRIIKEDYLWATVAGLAAAEKNYHVAELAYGELLETEKVLYLSEIRTETNPQIKSTLMTLFNGNSRDAQLALTQNGYTFRAIMNYIAMFQFDKALDLATKSKTHLDTVIGYRMKYLEQTGRKETDPKFLKHLSEVEIDWVHIREKIREDMEKETRAK